MTLEYFQARLHIWQKRLDFETSLESSHRI
jgi:hypothetical protein